MKHQCNRHSIRELLGIASERDDARDDDVPRTLRDYLGAAVHAGGVSFKRGCDLREQRIAPERREP